MSWPGHPDRLGLIAPTLLLFAAQAELSRAQQPRFVYPVPPADSYTVRTGITYRASSGTLPFDLFVPRKPTNGERLPVLVIFNGYGGSIMRTSEQSRAWAKAATAQGLAAIAVETTPGHAAEDFDSLTTYLDTHAADLAVDPGQIAVIAWSGNAATAVETVESPRRQSVKAAVMYYGSGPVEHVRLDLPVLFVRAGLDQPEWNRAMDSVIAAGLTANAPWSVVNYPAGHHGFDVFDDNVSSREMIEATFRFLHLVLSPSYEAGLRAGLPVATAASAVGTGDYARAVMLYQRLAEADPHNAQLLLAYGKALLGAKRYHEARNQFDRVKALGTAGPRDLGVPAARASMLDNDPDAAIAWLRSIPAANRPADLEGDPDFASLRGRADFEALFQH